MDAPQDPWVPAPRDGGRADIRAGGAGGDPWSPTVPFPRVAPAAERLPERVAPAPVPAPRRSAAPAVCDTGTPGLWRTCARAVARLVHVTVDGVRSLVALLAAAPASR
ncbi:hypothetical protein ACFPK1_26030 [Actinomycetospora rhizophila]|uniref:Uncharacterized protein n=1 Tax=Actinomycetospora rhizophila TaxID=1416876 RepID=A0ABV9ZNE4_9PSEU